MHVGSASRATEESTSVVECALGLVEPHLNERLNSIRGPTDFDLDGLARTGREVAEQVIGRVLPAGRTANADADSEEVAIPEGFADGSEPIVAVVATPELHPQLTGVYVEFIVYHDHLGRLQLVISEQPGDRPPGLVHESARFRQHQPRCLASWRSDSAFSDFGPAATQDAEPRADTACQFVGDSIADVVPMRGKGRAGVAEPDYEP